MVPLHGDERIISGSFSASKYKSLSFYMTNDLFFHCSSCSSERGLLAQMDFFPIRKSLQPNQTKPNQKGLKRKKEKQIIVAFSSKLSVETL